MKTIRYSPHPPEYYSRQDDNGRFGVGLEFVGEQFTPWWNLYWLSEPALDSLLLPENEWVGSKPLNLQMPQATADALSQKLGGVPLQVLLTRPMHVFLQRLRATPYTHLRPYEIAGDAWAACVFDRGALVQSHRQGLQLVGGNFGIKAGPLVVVPKPAFVIEGNVVRVNFSMGGEK